MSAIYYCPETSIMIPAYQLQGVIPVGNYITNENNNNNSCFDYYPFPGHYPLPMPSRGQMPEWLFDEDGNFTVSLQDVVELDLFFICVRDKKGSQFIQDNFPEKDSPLRRKLYDLLFSSQSVYNLAMDMFGNFVIQKMITEAGDDYGQEIIQCLAQQAADMAFNRFSCRVIQKAIDVFSPKMLEPLLQAFRGYILAMGTDQSANHVLQKVIDALSAKDYAFVVEEMCQSANMERMISNKFGCRVIQFCIEKLSKNYEGEILKDGNVEGSLLRSLMERISRKAFRFSQDEFANYIVQYIIKHNSLHVYRDRIIKHALLGNVVSLSQAKYSSHVVEQAFEYAPNYLFDQLLEEVFGADIHPKNGRDCLDQMLFDQYGNYIIQRLLNMAIKIRHGKRHGNASWFDALSSRIVQNAPALLKYSSGKKIIETVSTELGYSIL